MDQEQSTRLLRTFGDEPIDDPELVATTAAAAAVQAREAP
jgi:hypothetical protein